MEKVVQSVLDAIPRAGLVEVEVSARHVHLTDEHIEVLFGKGATLTPKRPLSQPGQFLSEERVTLIGPKGRKERTAVLGPARSATQIELSKS
ncbi:MAG: PduL/EutD family phosphate acyltransferase, partial [Butyricicoccus sp.]